MFSFYFLETCTFIMREIKPVDMNYGGDEEELGEVQWREKLSGYILWEKSHYN